MKTYRYLIMTVMSLIIASFAAKSIAKTLTLYDEPKSNAKVVETLDSNAGVIAIYSPTGDWMKVADPRNGNVGWIKKTDLNQAQFSVNLIRTGNGPGYQVIQFGNTKPFSSEQINQMMQQIQTQQQTLQKDIQKMTQDMLNNLNQQLNSLVMPIIITTPQNATTPSQPANKTPAVTPTK